MKVGKGDYKRVLRDEFKLKTIGKGYFNGRMI